MLISDSPDAAMPDCTAALKAWRYAYDKRNADGVYRKGLQLLMDEIQLLRADAPTGGESLTFAALHRMPQPLHDFYSGLIDAAECLSEQIDEANPHRTAYRHAALVLIGDALGALSDTAWKTRIADCCGTCKNELWRRGVYVPRPGLNRTIVPPPSMRGQNR